MTSSQTGERSRRRSQDGAVAVEFALVLPLLTILAFGIIAFGIVFAQQLALSNASRQAARFGVVADRTCTDIIAEAKSASNAIGMDGADATVTVERGGSDMCGGAGSVKPCEGSTTGSSIDVKVEYTTQVIIPLVVFDDSVDIAGSGTFRCEFS